MKCFAILFAEFFRHIYFRAMLILRYHSLGKCLFSIHVYFQERAYYREITVRMLYPGRFILVESVAFWAYEAKTQIVYFIITFF